MSKSFVVTIQLVNAVAFEFLILKNILTFFIELESTIKEKDDKGQEKEVKVICNNRPVKSEVQSKTGTGTWLCVLFWCVLTVFGGLVPFFVK